PSILLADEPTGNLDSRTSVEIMEIFQRLNDGGLTVVLVTHEHDIAQFAKRVIVFRDARIRRDEPLDDRPRAAEVLNTRPTPDDSGLGVRPMVLAPIRQARPSSVALLGALVRRACRRASDTRARSGSLPRGMSSAGTIGRDSRSRPRARRPPPAW